MNEPYIRPDDGIEVIPKEAFPHEQWEIEMEDLLKKHISLCQSCLKDVITIQSKHQFNPNEFNKYEEFVNLMDEYIKSEMEYYGRRFAGKPKPCV